MSGDYVTTCEPISSMKLTKLDVDERFVLFMLFLLSHEEDKHE